MSGGFGPIWPRGWHLVELRPWQPEPTGEMLSCVASDRPCGVLAPLGGLGLSEAGA